MTSKKILVIDDDQGILDAIRAILEMAHYRVETSTEAGKVEKLAAKKPDLILIDMLLSGKDGKILIKKLKGNPQTKDIPLIMLTAYPNAEQEIREAGADDFIAKPFDMNVLLETIKKQLGT